MERVVWAASRFRPSPILRHPGGGPKKNPTGERYSAAIIGWRRENAEPIDGYALLPHLNRRLRVGQATLDALDLICPSDLSPRASVFGISGPYISIRIAGLAERAGLGKGYSGHSCRIGTAQDLAAEGYSLTQLMTAGRWTNPVMPARYTRNQAAARGAVAQNYRQLSLFGGTHTGQPPTNLRLFGDNSSPVQTISRPQNAASDQRYAG